ncbi:MAG: nicotinamide mononucleotide transporter [Clostridia bacterium]|nr:nicotinamide mononucleotide transporter [Clostridia bacterium]
MNLLRTIKSLTLFEWCLWALSTTVVTLSFALSSAVGIWQFIGSLVGVTSLILVSKGNAIGQLLMIFFCLIYGFISFGESLYGEMITYMGMSLPMAVFSLISWLKNPSAENSITVKVNTISRREMLFMILGGVVVTVIFYFILSLIDTANIIMSTLSVLTSFIPAYLTFRRSPYFALGYVFNDIVVIVIWVVASIPNPSNWAFVACFSAFLLNDTYSFINWKRLEKSQKEKE